MHKVLQESLGSPSSRVSIGKSGWFRVLNKLVYRVFKFARCLMVGLPWGQFQGCLIFAKLFKILFIWKLVKLAPTMTEELKILFYWLSYTSLSWHLFSFRRILTDMPARHLLDQCAMAANYTLLNHIKCTIMLYKTLYSALSSVPIFVVESYSLLY